MIGGSATGVVGPHGLLFAWSVDPLVLVGLLAGAWWYTRGVRALGGAGRRVAVLIRGRAAAFAGGVLRPRHTHPSAGVVPLSVSMIASGLLAVLLVFAPSAWYAHAATRVYGLTPLQDQQAAGATMWVFGGIVYVVSGAAVLVRWLRADQRLAARRERRTPRRA